jgi:hypothetical protein
MREISGIISKIGSGTVTMTNVGKSFTKYDSIEIGDEVLQNVRTARSLGSYLEDGVGHHTTIYMSGKFIVGVRLPSGKLYYWKRSFIAPILGALAFVPVTIGLGAAANSLFIPILISAFIYFLIFRTELSHIFLCQSQLSSLKGIPLKS